MSRVCALTGARPKAGNNRPFSLKATRRRWLPNLIKKRILNPETGRIEKLKVTARAIRTLRKWEAQGAALAEQKVVTTPTAKTGTKERVKKEKLTPKQKKEKAAQQSSN